ncbi:MAG: DUF927 domain-containing protein [Selenomonadaceae bacterium]|nr:DUF927 domain-containing protein [Selenomonadaceae bacterium]
MNSDDKQILFDSEGKPLRPLLGTEVTAISHPVEPTTDLQLPMPREFNGKKYYGVADVAKIIGVTQQAVSKWQNELWHGATLFTADERAHDGRYLYAVERVMQLKEVYRPNWMRGSYEPEPPAEIIQGAINAPAQILENLPEELLRQKRFFPVNKNKQPCIPAWQEPKNQMTAAEAIKKTGLIGMDISGHGLNPDYFFVDFDNVLNGNKFIYPDAQKWYNYLSTAETFSETSISKGGCHFLLNPTPNIFPKLTGGNDCSIFFDDTKHGKNSPKIELFYLQNRWILLTADLLNCAPNTPIISGVCADEFAQQLINHVAYDHSSIKDTDAKKITFTDSDINVEEVQKMLAVIPCAKTQYNDWWKVAAILHHHFGANGFNPWRAWSETDKTRYTLEACQKVWSDLDKRSAANIGRPATIGSLIFFAKNFGYKPPKKNIIPVVMDDDQPTDDEPRTRDFIPDCPINARIPFNFDFSNGGIKFITPPKKETDEPKVTQVTRTPLVVTKVFTETKNFETQYEIAMKIDKSWRFITVDGRTLQDPRRVLDLAGTGALIEAPPILAKYFIRFIAINRDAITKTKVYSQPGWHDDKFIYPTGGEDYICSRSNINYDELFSKRGDFDTWKKKFHDISCSRNGGLKRAALGAFWLPPLLRILHLPNFWLHLQGKKNFAKTPLIKFGLSIYGNPAETYLLRTFDSSPKNRVTMAVAMNDLPQAIDELETLSAKETAEIQKSIYDYVSGMDGQKNQKSGDVRPVTRFRGVRISTGERPILDNNAKGGAFKRCITLHITEPLFNDEEARQLHIFCEKNHGHCGKLWTDYVARHEEEIFADFERMLADLPPEFKEFEPAHIRAIAGCTVAFWHARKCFGLEETFDAYHAKADVSLITRLLPTQEEISDTNRGIDLLASWTNEHPKNFMTYGDKTGTVISATSFTETSGIQFPDGRVAFFPNAFKRICEDELHLPSYDKFLNELYDEGKLICPNRREKAKQLKIGGRNTRVYLFKAGALVTVDDDITDDITDDISYKY